LFTDGSWRLAPCPSSSLPPISGALSAILPLLLCASFQFVVYCAVYFFLAGGSVCPGGYAGLYWG
jgi:hypothetical protein